MSGCARYRELLSADLDNEAGAADPTAPRVDLADAYRHLADCPPCRDWFARVTRVNRLVRTQLSEPAPGLSEARLARLLDQLPVPRRAGWRARQRPALRIALGLVGLAQLVLAGLELGHPDAAAMAHQHVGTLLAGTLHLAHEFSAWNLAMGVCFAVGAAWPRHLAGVLPLLGSFVAVLTVLTVLDVAHGRVEPGRVSSHLLIVVGLALVLLLVRTRPRLRSGAPHRIGPSWPAAEHHVPAPAAAPPVGPPPGQACRDRAVS